MLGRSLKQDSVRLYTAAAVRDAAGVDARPGAVAVRGGRIVAAGTVEDVRRSVGHASIAQTIERPEHLLLPLMVNAHAHLDLTDLPPTPYGGDFMAWLHAVKTGRPTDPDAVAAAVRRGLAMSAEAGVGYLGDIANSPLAIRARQDAPCGLPGVSYLECFGLGKRQTEATRALDAKLESLVFETPIPGHTRGVVLGISPHAPTTAGPEVFEHATRLSKTRAYRLATHAAETPDEIEFLRTGGGPWRDHLQRLGVWDDAITPPGEHPIDFLAPFLKQGRWLLAHCNYVDDEHIRLLKKSGTGVAYCPVASDYFGHTGHRYRDMLDAGIEICLGTDSIICQPTGGDACQPLGILDQMRHLWRRDRTDPHLLLKMATVNGMLALEFREDEATLGKGAPALFATVRIDPSDEMDPLEQALSSRERVEVLRDADFGS